MAAAFFSFLITLVGLVIIVGMIFLALDRIAKDEFLKKIGKLAVGGCAFLVLLFSARATFFGGGGAGAVSPVAIIEFAIGVIILVAMFYLLDLAVDRWAKDYAVVLNYVLSIVMLVILLYLAEQALFGGGLGLMTTTGASHFPGLAK